MNGAIGKGEHLEPSRVCDQRPIQLPAHEGVQAASFLDYLRSRVQHEVVSVAKHELDALIVYLSNVHGLDGAIRSNRHEPRRVYIAMRRMYSTYSRTRSFGLMKDFKIKF